MIKPTREWRKFLAMILLSMGGMALTIVSWHLVDMVAQRSPNDPWALAYALYGALGLIGLVLISLGWTLGKSSLSVDVAGSKVDLSGGDQG